MRWLAAVLCTLALGAWAKPGDHNIVYHMNEGAERAPQMIRNIRNRLNADPKAHIVVVSHAAGINFLLKDAKDANGNPFQAGVQELVARGVEFRACEFTFKSRNIDPKTQLIEEAILIPSGVAEVGRLQFEEGYAYLKP